MVPLRLVSQTGVVPASRAVKARACAPEGAQTALTRSALTLDPGLEETAVPGGPGPASGVGFWLARAASAPGERLIALVAPRNWLAERGRLFARGAMRFGVRTERLLVVRPRTEAEALWALEEILRSGAADLAIGAVETASLTQTRRLDMAAREAGAAAGLIRVGEGGGLSAARKRWRVAPLASAEDRWDPRAPGRPRWRAELTRRRDGPPGVWDLEWNDAAGRLDLVEGLAGDGLGEDARVLEPLPVAHG